MLPPTVTSEVCFLSAGLGLMELDYCTSRVSVCSGKLFGVLGWVSGEEVMRIFPALCKKQRNLIKSFGNLAASCGSSLISTRRIGVHVGYLKYLGWSGSKE